MDTYVVISTVTLVNHLTLEERKEMCMKARGEGKRAEILSAEDARYAGVLEPMQDLTKLT